MQTYKEGITRVVIEGEPGVGKTTFMKALCRAWAEDVLNQKDENLGSAQVQIHDVKRNNINEDDDETDDNHEQDNKEDTDCRYIGRYTLLLAFILRQVTEEKALMDVIKNQFQFLTCSELCAIENLLQHKQRHVCLFFDGFDELKDNLPDIQQLRQIQLLDTVPKKDDQNVFGITTTRSQGVMQLKRCNSDIAYALVKCCGFNNKQIKKYICYYFKESEDESDMIKAITNDNLWELASIPIRLQMMCFVWQRMGKLGKNMNELYKQLLLGLLDHMEKRNNLTLTSEEKILEKYHESVILPTAALADRWDKDGNLTILFSMKDIEVVSKTHTEQIMDLGCITKYFAMSTMVNEWWNFTHLSLQEYFVAYHITHSQTSLTAFEIKCHNMRAIEKYQLIIEFLSAMAPEKGNHLLQSVIVQDYTERECVQLLNLILHILKMHTDLSTVKIPLPRIVKLDRPVPENRNLTYFQELEKRRRIMSHLFMEDSKIQNMTMLKLNKLEELPDQAELDFSYLKGLFVTIDKQDNLNKVCHILSKLSNETNILDFVFFYSITGLETDKLISHIGTKSVSSFSLKGSGSGIVSLASGIMKQQPKLEILTIHDTADEAPNKSYLQAMCDEANKHIQLKELNLVGPMLGKPLTSLNKQIKVTVCSTQVTQFVEDVLPCNPNISEVDLSFSKFSSELKKAGEYIARIMTFLQMLLVLKLRKCGLTSDTISLIEGEIRLSNKRPQLQHLDLLGNNICSCTDLHGLLDCCPRLEIVLFSFKENSKLPKVHQNLKMIMATGTEENPTCLQFSESMNHLHKLYIIYTVPDFSQIKDSNIYQLKILYILNLPMVDVPKSMEALSKNIGYMTNLTELHFTTVHLQKLTSIEYVLALVKVLPSTLKLLNLFGYDSSELINILDEKYQMDQLEILNIGSTQTSKHAIQIIRQELQQLYPTLEVYCDPEETLSSILKNATIDPSSDILTESTQKADDLLDVLSRK